MKVIIIDEKNNHQLTRFFSWLLHIVGYAVVLIAVSLIFKKTIYLDESFFGFWSLAAAVIVYILNRTIKPVLIWLTLPITGLTLGLFYPFINVFILNMVDFILGKHFNINGIWMSFLVAIMISLMNAIMETVIVDPIVKRGKQHE